MKIKLKEPHFIIGKCGILVAISRVCLHLPQERIEVNIRKGDVCMIM